MLSLVHSSAEGELAKAKALDIPARECLERLFGRPLGDDEDVTIVLSAPHAAPPAAERRAAFQWMERILDRAADNMRGDCQLAVTVFSRGFSSATPPTAGDCGAWPNWLARLRSAASSSNIPAVIAIASG
jgi:hypothetical protein